MLGSILRSGLLRFNAAKVNSKAILISQHLPSINNVVRTMANARHKKIIKLAKGYRGRANRCFKIALKRVMKARQYAYRDRKVNLTFTFIYYSIF
jgi:hypothetical protein